MSQYADHDRQGSSFMLGIVAGTAIGAGLALLFAPREGAQLRRELADGAHRLGEQLHHTSDTVRQTARRAAGTAQDLIERGRHAYHDAADQVRHMASRGADTMDRQVDDAARTARQTVRQTANTVESAASRIGH